MQHATDTDTDINTDEALEVKPFSLNYDATAGLQDFRPKVASADPKESADALLGGQEKQEESANQSQDRLPLVAETGSSPVLETITPKVEEEKKILIPPVKKTLIIPNVQ